MLENQKSRFPVEPDDLLKHRKLALTVEGLRPSYLDPTAIIAKTVERMIESSDFNPMTEVLMVVVEPDDNRGWLTIQAQTRPHHKEL